VLELAPTPEQGRQLTRAAVRRALVGAGRRRNLQARVVAVHNALSAPQLAAPAPIEAAYREVVSPWWPCSAAAISRSPRWSSRSPPASLPIPTPRSCAACLGLGWCWARGCWASSATIRTGMPPPRAARRSPAPRRSPGPRGCAPWWSPGRRATSGWWMPATCGRSRRFRHRRVPSATTTPTAAHGATHHQALRALGNRLVGILHGCLAHRVAYQEQLAWLASAAAA
jgi:hypothetical protein